VLPSIEEILFFLVTESFVLSEIIKVLRREMTGKVFLAKRRIPVFGVAGPIALATIVFRGATALEPLVEQTDDVSPKREGPDNNQTPLTLLHCL
jgi:hypothetical protein